MKLTQLIKIWLLMAMIALSANGAVKANIASGLQNLSLEVHQGKNVSKPLKRQEKTECSTTGVSVIFIEEDKETGLLYAKARFYDPDTGKFLSEDAWEGDHMIAPSLHRYLYAYQNPTVYVDRDGNAAHLASGAEFDELGYQLYSDGKHVQAAGVAVASAFYRFGTGFFSFGLFDQANDAITTNDTYSGAAKQFGNEVVQTGKEVVQEYATEGVVAGTATVASKAACGRFRQACGTVSEKAGQAYDYLNKERSIGNKDTGLVSENQSGVSVEPNEFMNDDSFIASGSSVHHGKHSTAIGSDDKTLGNFGQATETDSGHNIIVHGSRPDYDGQGGTFFVDGQATNSQQIVDAVKSNPNYVEGSPVCLGSCWSGSNGTAQEVSNALDAKVSAPTRPVRFNENTNEWEQMSDQQMIQRGHEDLLHIEPEIREFEPE